MLFHTPNYILKEYLVLFYSTTLTASYYLQSLLVTLLIIILHTKRDVIVKHDSQLQIKLQHYLM